MKGILETLGQFLPLLGMSFMVVGEGEGEGAAGEGAAGEGGTPPVEIPVEPVDWRTNLSPELKEHPSLATYKSVDDMAKSHINAQKLIGKKGIIPPGKDAKPEEIDAFHKALGRPDKPEDYKLSEVQAPEGMTEDANLKSGFLATAHAKGMTNEQADAIYSWYNKQVEGAIAQHVEKNKVMKETTEAELRTEYGKAYDQNLDIAKKFIHKFGDEKAMQALEEGLGNDPRLIRMLVKAGKSFSEDMLHVSSNTTLTPDEAKAEIRKIKGDPKHPYFVQVHHEHKEAVDYMDSLYKQAYPDRKEE